MKTIKARVRDGSIRLPKRLHVKDGTEVRVLIPEPGTKRLSPQRQKLFDEIMTLREQTRPADSSIVELVREMRQGGRKLRR